MTSRFDDTPRGTRGFAAVSRSSVPSSLTPSSRLPADAMRYRLEGGSSRRIGRATSEPCATIELVLAGS